MEKKKRRLNIVDIVVIVVILAAAAFFGWKLTHRGGDSGAQARPGTIRFVIEVDGLRKDMYDATAALMPCQMAASGSLVDGYILESWANPVKLIKAISAIKAILFMVFIVFYDSTLMDMQVLCQKKASNRNPMLFGRNVLRLNRLHVTSAILIFPTLLQHRRGR